MIVAGIDAGSRANKIILLDGDSTEVLATHVSDQGVDTNARVGETFARMLADRGLSRADVARIVATGYGRNIVNMADTAITEITCHARGIHHVVPKARTVVEIGGQDSKLLRLDADGSVRDFSMNDRCAAGTGRFLEVVASRLGVNLEAMSALSARSTAPASISSMCVVFAETEIIGLLAAGTPPADIVAGVQNAIASRVAAMAGRRVTPPVVFTGGVAMIDGMRHALSQAMKQDLILAPDPQMTGALGAALLAARELGIRAATESGHE